MTLPIAETAEKTPSSAAFDRILRFLQGKQALAIGPGISTNEDTAALVRKLIRNASCPMVLDADAITGSIWDPGILRNAQVPLVLTPHPGEMARICHCTVPEVRRNRLESAAKFSRECGVVLVLKGHRTIIAAPDGKLAINSTGNPAMASGGMGDTLTGIVAGLLPRDSMLFGPPAWVSTSTGPRATGYSRGFRAGGFWQRTCWTKSPLY